jgi:hypothetical protein
MSGCNYCTILLPVPESVQAASWLMARTPAQGTTGDGVTRRVFRCHDAASASWRDPSDNTLLISSEAAMENPTEMEAAEAEDNDLTLQATNVALVALIARHLPESPETRIAALRALTGVLLRNGERIDADAEDATNYLNAVIQATGLSISIPAERIIADTAQRLKAEKPVAGIPRLRELIGEVVANQALEWLGVTEATPERPQVVMGGQLREMTDRCVDVLVKSNKPQSLFVRNRELVSVQRDVAGAARLVPIDRIGLRCLLAENADFVTIKAKQGKDGADPELVVTPTVPRIDVCENVLARGVYPTQIPSIRGVVSSPVFAANGTLHTAPGYLPAVEAYYDELTDTVLTSSALTETTSDNVSRAVEFLRTPFSGFPFGDQASIAHVFAALIEPHVRSMIGRTPLYLIEAPQRATGKSLLAETLVAAFQPRGCAFLTFPQTEEEAHKVISSAAMRGPSHIVFDNLEGRIASAALCTALTSENGYSARILGRSEQVEIPLDCTWLSTANNAMFHADITSRSVLIRLDAGLERPEERQQFSVPDPPRWMRENRARVLDSVLLLVRYWIAQGCPAYDGRQRCRFPAWLSVIGGILQSAGIDGLLENTERLREGTDSESVATGHYVSDWWERHQSTQIGMQELLRMAFGPEDLMGRRQGGVLSEALAYIDDRNPAKKFGWWLRRQRDRVYGSHRIRCAVGRATLYWLEPVREGEPIEKSIAPFSAKSAPFLDRPDKKVQPIDDRKTPFAPFAPFVSDSENVKIESQKSHPTDYPAEGEKVQKVQALTATDTDVDIDFLSWGEE